MTDLGAFAAVNEVYATFFEAEPPARGGDRRGSAARRARSVEIDAIVAVGNRRPREVRALGG